MLVIRRLFGAGTNCIAPSGLPLLLCLFPGLAPWAFLSRPAGLVSRQKLALAKLGHIFISADSVDLAKRYAT